MDVERDFERVANLAVHEAKVIDHLVSATLEIINDSDRRYALELLISTGRVNEVLSKARKLPVPAQVQPG